MSNQNTVSKTITIIEWIANQKTPVAVIDVEKGVNFPLATVHRLMHQLLDDNVIEKLPNKNFYFTHRFIDIAIKSLNSSELLNQRRSILEQISLEAGETCNLSIRKGSKVIYFDRVESNWPYKISLSIGSYLPTHCTASGKLFLAFSKSKITNKFKNLVLKKETQNTITDKDLFKKELKIIHKQKFSIDNQEYIDGMVAIAVPVFLENKNQPFFTLSIHAPLIRKSIDDLKKYLDLLNNASKDISDIYATGLSQL